MQALAEAMPSLSKNEGQLLACYTEKPPVRFGNLGQSTMAYMQAWKVCSRRKPPFKERIGNDFFAHAQTFPNLFTR